MASSLFLFLILKYSILCVVNSAPSRVKGQTVTIASPSRTVAELGATNGQHLVNASSNSSKIPNGGKNVAKSELELRVQPGARDIDGKMNDTGEVKTTEDVDIPVTSGVRKEGAQSNVMALSDDVITDALFTNIDTLQDHLEVCEEGLRQQLRLRSHGKLLQDAEEAGYKPGTSEPTTRKEDKKESSDVKTGNDDDDEDDDDDDDSENNDDGSDSADEKNDEKSSDENDSDDADKAGKKIQSSKLLSSTARTKQHSLKRRSVPAGASSHDSLSLHKMDTLAQKVVNRLSERLDYLRMSLVQCHLLYRQFELL